MYNEADSSKHSSILGYAFDGYPIYGPYAYANPNSANSGVKLMEPSYKTRSITRRTSLSNGTLLAATQYGPGRIIN